ncbi:isoleucyl-tRNA synthetase family protein, putative [Babesia bigemina]|uniref:isoleucine--tRNA ligase n=1 Tax=Babesia bigemina TaxID=5866 RepID=A0A061D853_BABBI|nr:isoleucyl-tRNA synthetase family protein, putative [Babesia bigemina]CDR96851.1 isoleucyl-tRNA synthetase family protein, putative [Babesia bigemina]|eukprot:XP_012769037.1 isoleucyl-tRNA synthetase family protein, putative [Babesia bigemina]
MAQGSAASATFLPVDEKVDFPKEEEAILRHWKEIDVFHTANKLASGRPKFTFYDGPPFATGLPHYGHILAGTIKDVVTRYAYQTGHDVERRFGWDCHGLPIEYEIDKLNNIKHLSDVQKMGIGVYNEKCREIVMRYSGEWREIIARTGRWIDFDNDYKTLNTSYMETLWWVFKQLFEKGVVYRGFQVMPYSLACTTPVSNFEANLNYKDVTDPAVYVAFRCVDEPVELVAWTTTPWTLPSNLALIVNAEFVYVVLHHEQRGVDYVVAECRMESFCNDARLVVDKDVRVVRKLQGSELVGKRYEPLFEYYASEPGFDEEQLSRSYVIVGDKMVTADAGSGIVHAAPYFGEEDMRVCKRNGVIRGALPELIDESGNFKSHLQRLGGMYIKDADSEIKRMLKERGRLVHAGTLVHSYPFCWRSDTPLVYRAVSCWFIKVEEYREDILRCVEQTQWVPRFVKEKRFRNWIADARDWCVSRNRFWGTPIPLWVSEDYTQVVCVGSIEELERLSGRKVSDLHRHFVDEIEIPDPRGPGFKPLRRIPEIFDCWYESGSMPYAKIHYPFENKESFPQCFPADFIAEGLDQTRGWFYTLMVLSTHLFGAPAFRNIIVNGLVLASDGKKMSKRLKNFADPVEVINQYGADSVRLYLISSPAVRAEPLRFMTDGVRGILKDVILPWFHAYRFLVQEASRFEVVTGRRFVPSASAAVDSSCVMDRWLHSITQQLIDGVHREMGAYRLYNVLPQLLAFLEQLTNWYIRINRDRMRGAFGEDESYVSLASLYSSLDAFTCLMSMFAPFTSEMIYANLKRAAPGRMESIHFEMLPRVSGVVDEEITFKVRVMQQVILLGRTVRERRRVSLKTPIAGLKVVHEDERVLSAVRELEALVKDELNVMNVELSKDVSCISCQITPNFKALGARLGQAMKPVAAAIKGMSQAEIARLESEGSADVLGHTITLDDVVISRRIDVGALSHPDIDGDSNREVAVLLDFTSDESLRWKACAREVANRVQKLRKQLRLSVNDSITIYVQPHGELAFEKLSLQTEYLEKTLRRSVVVTREVPAAGNVHSDTFELGEQRFSVAVEVHDQ